MFLQPSRVIYDKDGKYIYEGLIPGNIYTVSESYIISIKLREIEGVFLKENFRKYVSDTSK